MQATKAITGINFEIVKRPTKKNTDQIASNYCDKSTKLCTDKVFRLLPPSCIIFRFRCKLVVKLVVNESWREREKTKQHTAATKVLRFENFIISLKLGAISYFLARKTFCCAHNNKHRKSKDKQHFQLVVVYVHSCKFHNRIHVKCKRTAEKTCWSCRIILRFLNNEHNQTHFSHNCKNKLIAFHLEFRVP